ncbi:MAG: LPP20 family lipoprotein [Melioribacteraceae bacterium]|nr:LPP20 family lipoprotein [Melioribacteraceae bacterium]
MFSYSIIQKLFLPLLLSLFSISITAQSVGFKAFCSEIKNSDAYYYGMASSEENMRIAENNALGQLLNQIAVHVSSSFEHNISETDKKLSESVSKILKTYSTASLRNVDSKKDFYKGKSFVIRFIKKSVVSKIFEKRKELAYELFQNAIEFEGNSNHGDALKYYYYSVILMNSIPEQNVVFNKTNLKSEVPKRINSILHNIKFSLITSKKVSAKERVVTYAISVNGKPTSNLQFSFWEGNNFIDVEAKDGAANIDLLGGSVNFDKLDVRIEYAYYSNRREIKEVSELWDLVVRPKFDNDFQIKIKKKDIVSVDKKTRQFDVEDKTSKTLNEVIKSSRFTLNLNNKASCEIVEEIGKEAITYLELLEREDKNKLKEFLVGDTYLIKKSNDLMKYNRVKIMDETIYANLNKTASGFEIRKVKVLNKYNSLNKQTTEYLILDFDENGKIYDVNFGITESLYDEFVERAKFGNDWGNREIIIKFIEKYRTAYLARDIEVLDKIFAEDALIIIGRVLKTNKNNDAVSYVKLNEEQPDFEQIKYTKTEYLIKQRRIFKSREDIFLGFSKFGIHRKNDTTGIYGVSLRQGYESTGYSDEGYLFLLIDFNRDNPQIYVRSWQPQEWDAKSLLGLSNFRINK